MIVTYVLRWFADWLVCLLLPCCCFCSSQACDVLDYVPVVGRVVRFASTSVMNYYHQFHFYTSAS